MRGSDEGFAGRKALFARIVDYYTRTFSIRHHQVGDINENNRTPSLGSLLFGLYRNLSVFCAIILLFYVYSVPNPRQIYKRHAYLHTRLMPPSI